MSTDGASQNHLDVHSGLILAVFVIVSIFVIWPLYIPLLPPVQRWLLTTLKTCRIIDQSKYDSLSSKRLYFPLSLETAPIIGVILLIATTTINGNTIKLGIIGDGNVKPYDVLVLFISLAYISIALDGTGALEAVAFWVSKRGGSSGIRLFTYLYAFFFGMGCIVGNDPLILSGTPFLAYLTQHTGIDPIPWVFSEFMAANTASAVLVSSNPTNILIAGSFNLNYLTEFTKWTVLPSVIPALLNYPLLLAIFWKQIPRKITPLEEDPWSRVRDPIGAVFFSTLMVVTVAILVGTSFVPGHSVDVWMVTAPAGILAFLFELGSDLKTGKQRASIPKTILSNDSAEMQPIDQTGSRPSQTSRTSNRQHQNTINRNPPLPTNTGISEPTDNNNNDRPSPPFPPKPPHNPNPQPPTLLTILHTLSQHLPRTTHTTTRLPLPLLPFAISQFILVRSLAQHHWLPLFARALSHACTTPLTTTFLFTFLSAALLCPLAGTNIGATIILVEILRDPAFAQSSAVTKDPRVLNAAVYAVAVGSNLGAVSYTFAASLAGLLWRGLLEGKGVIITRRRFAVVNMLPLVGMGVVAAGVVWGEVLWFS